MSKKSLSDMVVKLEGKEAWLGRPSWYFAGKKLFLMDELEALKKLSSEPGEAGETAKELNRLLRIAGRAIISGCSEAYFVWNAMMATDRRDDAIALPESAWEDELRKMAAAQEAARVCRKLARLVGSETAEKMGLTPNPFSDFLRGGALTAEFKKEALFSPSEMASCESFAIWSEDDSGFWAPSNAGSQFSARAGKAMLFPSMEAVRKEAKKGILGRKKCVAVKMRMRMESVEALTGEVGDPVLMAALASNEEKELTDTLARASEERLRERLREIEDAPKDEGSPSVPRRRI